MQIEENHSLLSHNTFHIPAIARWFAHYDTEEELRQLLTWAREKHLRLLPIGGGSNLLFCADFDGLVLHSRMCFIETLFEDDQEVLLRVGSGVVWDDFVATTVANGWGGCENLSLIPGEVGAAAVQNIGAYGVEIKELIEAVECISVATGDSLIFTSEACSYGYRSSIFKHELKGAYIVTAVQFRLSKNPTYRLAYGHLKEALGAQPITLQTIRNTVIEVRRKKLPDPDQMGSAGSFFMNPVIDETHYRTLQTHYPEIPGYPDSTGGIKVPAGWLIEQSGLKGFSIGGAAVYEKQCLVLVNRTGNATSQEIQQLAAHVVNTVKERFGIILTPEANYIQ